MRPIRFVATLAFCGCTSFDDGVPADGGASSTDATTDGAVASDAGTNDGSAIDGGQPTTGCAARTGFLLCSDFDDSMNVAQPTKPDNKPWNVQLVGTMPSLAVISRGGYSGPNVLLASGDGTGASFTAQALVSGIPVAKNVMHLTMAMRVRSLPASRDAFLSTLELTNLRISAVLHPDGTVGLAQTVLPNGQVTKFDAAGANKAVPDAWTSLELYVDRNKSEVAARVGTIGAATKLLAIPTGDATVAVGIGYCDAPCGKPSVEFDDVVLTAE